MREIALTDAWGRLVKVTSQKSGLVVAEYTYNGLGMRTGWHYDVSSTTVGVMDGVVDGNDPWFWFCYDADWRLVGTYRDTRLQPQGALRLPQP
jgi:hypothetical protein